MTQTPIWDFGDRDRDHVRWGWSRLTTDFYFDSIWPKLRDFERMTWAEIQAASGGRSSGNNHHHVEVAGLCREARDRLQALKHYTDTLFSLRSFPCVCKEHNAFTAFVRAGRFASSGLTRHTKSTR